MSEYSHKERKIIGQIETAVFKSDDIQTEISTSMLQAHDAMTKSYIKIVFETIKLLAFSLNHDCWIRVDKETQALHNMKTDLLIISRSGCVGFDLNVDDNEVIIDVQINGVPVQLALHGNQILSGWVNINNNVNVFFMDIVQSTVHDFINKCNAVEVDVEEKANVVEVDFSKGRVVH